MSIYYSSKCWQTTDVALDHLRTFESTCDASLTMTPSLRVLRTTSPSTCTRIPTWPCALSVAQTLTWLHSRYLSSLFQMEVNCSVFQPWPHSVVETVNCDSFSVLMLSFHLMFAGDLNFTTIFYQDLPPCLIFVYLPEFNNSFWTGVFIICGKVICFWQ